MTPRKASRNDFSAILTLNEAFVRWLSPLNHAGLEALDEQAAFHRVVEIKGEIAAFLLGLREGAAYDSPNYQWFERRFDRFLYIDRVVVSNDFRRLGLATLLYADLESLANASQTPRLVCEYNLDPPNPGSAAFHHSLGFREVGQQALATKGKTVSYQALELPRS